MRKIDRETAVGQWSQQRPVLQRFTGRRLVLLKTSAYLLRMCTVELRAAEPVTVTGPWCKPRRRGTTTYVQLIKDNGEIILA